ncbi:MAG: UPF0179 family protein [Candidatus Thermoplasmatota archaeon]|nr:UPF0179 family protein [Candidatus Thermoplasmatota archaeon]
MSNDASKSKSHSGGPSSKSGGEKGKTFITTVGKKQAVKNYVFLYTGPLSECKACKVKSVCFGLTPGRYYRVIGVRDRTHECKIFADGVRVVDVELAPMKAVVEKKRAIEGTVITLEDVKCRKLSCPHYKACKPFRDGLRKGDKLKIISLEGGAECSQGGDLMQVMVIPVD